MKTTLLLTTALLSVSTSAFAAPAATQMMPRMPIIAHPIVAPIVVRPVVSKPIVPNNPTNAPASTASHSISPAVVKIVPHVVTTVARVKPMRTVTTPLHSTSVAPLKVSTLTPKVANPHTLVLTPAGKVGLLNTKPAPKPNTPPSSFDILKQAQKDEAAVAVDTKRLSADEQKAQHDLSSIGNMNVDLTPAVARAQVQSYLSDLAVIDADKHNLSTAQTALTIDKARLGEGAPPPAPPIKGVFVPTGPIFKEQKTILTSIIAADETKDDAALKKATTAQASTNAALTAATNKVANDLANNQLATFSQDLKTAIALEGQSIQGLKNVSAAESAVVNDFSNMQKLNKDPVK